MEIVTTPSLPAPSPRSRLLVVLAVLAPVTALALLPVTLGLDRYVVGNAGTTPSYSRGTILLERSVPVGDLARGDVITFRPPGSGTRAAVTRRVDTVRAGIVRTRLDESGAVDPWRLRPGPEPVQRVVLALPLLGYPYLALASGGTPMAAAVLAGAAGLAAAVVLGRRRGRPAAS